MAFALTSLTFASAALRTDRASKTRWWIPLFLLLGLATAVPSAAAQEEEAERKGSIISIRGAIDTGSKYRVLNAARNAARNGDQILIFDIQAANSDFDACYGLANEISRLGGSVERTIAYVSQPLVGHAVLIALACDEIVMSDGARIGDVYRDRQLAPTITEETAYKDIASRKGHSVWLALGMVDKNLQLVEVTTPTGKLILPEDQLESFSKDAKVLAKETIKQQGEPLFLSAEQAQRYNLIQLIAETRAEVISAYRLPESTLAEDKLLDEATRPVLLKLEGTIDGRMHQYVLRRIKQARDLGSNLAFIEVDSTTGDETAANNIAIALKEWPEAKKVAWVKNHATGPAALVLFGCDELMIAPSATVGDFYAEDASEDEYRSLAEDAVSIAEGSKYPLAIVQGMVDPNVAVFQVRNKETPALTAFKTAEELEQPEVKELWIDPKPIKEPAVRLTMDGTKAHSLDFAVGLAETEDELTSRYDVSGQVIVLRPGWVDALVNGLTSVGGTVFLLVVGMFCLYIEFQLPGFGIAGLVSAVCFVLFFWSRYLSDTANSLEIVMFLLGVAFIMVELFVVPGFTITGMAGVALLFGSLLLASQSFTLPTTESERRELVVNGLTLLASFVVFIGAAVTLGRFFPRVPLFNRLILAPPGELAAEEDLFLEEDSENASPYQALLGREGIAASPLRPAGRMLFDERYFDVVTRGEFIDTGSPVRVVAVYQNRIVVSATTAS